MGARKGVNEKKQKGMDLKAANKAAKDAVKAAAQERKEGKHCIHVFVKILSTFHMKYSNFMLAEEWNKGANNRGADRAAAAGKF